MASPAAASQANGNAFAVHHVDLQEVAAGAAAQKAKDALVISNADIVQNFPLEIVKALGGVETISKFRRQKYFKFSAIPLESKPIYDRDRDFLKTMKTTHDVWLEVGVSDDLNEDGSSKHPTGKPIVALVICKTEESDAKDTGPEESFAVWTRKYLLPQLSAESKKYQVIYRYCFLKDSAPMMRAYAYHLKDKMEASSEFTGKLFLQDITEFVHARNVEMLTSNGLIAKVRCYTFNQDLKSLQQIIDLIQQLTVPQP